MISQPPIYAQKTPKQQLQIEPNLVCPSQYTSNFCALAQLLLNPKKSFPLATSSPGHCKQNFIPVSSQYSHTTHRQFTLIVSEALSHNR